MIQLLGTGIVNDTINRYMIPFSSKRSEWSLVKGEKIRVYRIVNFPKTLTKTGEDLIVIHFKRNNSRKITHWVFKEDDFIKNITLNPSKFHKKLFSESK